MEDIRVENTFCFEEKVACDKRDSREPGGYTREK